MRGPSLFMRNNFFTSLHLKFQPIKSEFDEMSAQCQTIYLLIVPDVQNVSNIIRRKKIFISVHTCRFTSANEGEILKLSSALHHAVVLELHASVP